LNYSDVIGNIHTSVNFHAYKRLWINRILYGYYLCKLTLDLRK